MSVGPQFDVDAPEDAPHAKASHITKKDVRWMVGILLVLGIIGTPLYFMFQQQRDKQVCATNMHAIWQAMMLYASENGDRLPPLYNVGPNGAPALNSEGKPLVWATLLKPYMNNRAEFFCPAAEEDEKMPAIGDDEGDILLTYGMYVAMGATPHMLLAKPDDTALLVETSNNGAQGSFNPLPFRDENGNVVPFDAFSAAYDDSNQMLTPDSRWITRLAIRGVANGYETEGSTPRHGRGIHLFYVNGTKGYIKSPDAHIQNIFPDAEGPWRVK
jgi:hypothetical protein